MAEDESEGTVASLTASRDVVRDMWISAEQGGVAAGVVEALHVQQLHVYAAQQAVPALPSAVRSPVLQCPRTRDQQATLLEDRPPAWEYPLDGGILWQRRDALSTKIRDHWLRYARGGSRFLDNREAADFGRAAIRNLTQCGPNLMRVLDPTIQVQAFGPPGHDGDPAMIEHVATRLVDIYEHMLDIAADLRSASAPAELAPVLEATAQLTDQPLRDIDEFIDQYVRHSDSLPERLAAGERVEISLALTLTMDPAALKAHKAASKRAKRHIGS